jgi:hypothetical protein
MSDIRIVCNTRCIQNICNKRLLECDDTKDVRQAFRDILGFAEEVIRVDADSDQLAASPCNHYWQLNHGDEPFPNRCSLCGMLATHEYADLHNHKWGEETRDEQQT